ncbi:MAG: hypothetical protein RBT60_08805 [Candidatus Krumholzibacteria bacterium]|jgi:hypothetical protein|nr:hypothetical protein [Candidatus Krumholzibacteria bacterium]
MVHRKSALIGTLVLPAVLLTACSVGNTGGGDMKKYLEFYFPTSGAASYSVVHDWGEYLIVTEAGPQDELHPDSEPYRGFVTMRPYIAAGRTVTPTPLIYCITPAGEVWATADLAAVPAAKTRVEVSDQGGGTTLTSTIESPSEAVIDCFREQPGIWTRFGRLEVKGGKTRFKAER